MGAPPERWYSVEGRIRRSTWLARVLGAGLGMVLITGLFVAVLPHHRGQAPFAVIPILGLVLSFFVFRIIQDVKRLHDLGYSGAWAVCAFVPAVNLVYVLFIIFADGQPMANAYGPDPKGRGSDIDDIADVFR